MQQVTVLQTAFAKFSGDFTIFSAAVQAQLTALAANQVSPTDAQALTDMATAFGTMDATVLALETSLAAPAPVTTPAPTTP